MTPIRIGSHQAEDRHVDRAAGVMRAERTDRGRDDDGKRGADAERHPDLQRHAGQPKAFVEHRHQDGAAADPEQAGQKSGERADRDQQQPQLDQLLHVEPGDCHVFSPYFLIPNKPFERASSIPASNLSGRVNDSLCRAPP